MKLKVGDPWKAVYRDAPLPVDRQYAIGSQISIHEDDRLLGFFQVLWTDDTHIEGVISEVVDSDSEEET